MKRIAIIITITLIAFLSSTAQTVDEAKTRTFFDKNDLVVELAFDAALEKAADDRLDLLRENDSVFVRSEKAEIAAGAKTAVVRFPHGTERDVDDLVWKRIRYSLQSGAKYRTGIVSVSQIMPDLFKINAVSSSYITSGMSYVVHVTTVHPVTGMPVPNVELSGTLKLNEDDDELANDLLAVGSTDAAGFGTLIFQIPDDVVLQNYEYGELELKGARNGINGSADENINTRARKPEVLINTDKPLYQPGQTLFVRGLATAGPENGKLGIPIAGRELEFRIKDEESTTLYRETVTTSRFGISSIKWQIPDNAKLGRFSIEAEFTETEDTSYSNFRVSRYELPNFVVNPKPEKDYFLPKDKTARVKIDATYLFGKRVAAGKVKVVRESARSWNYSEQKWDITEEETYEGATDESGVYEAEIDLKAAHKELAEDDDQKFSDLTFTAYFTDSTSNITEERKFDLRVTKEELHVYFIGLNGRDLSDKLPLRFFVSTTRADGTPVASDVEIVARYQDYKKLKNAINVRTNRFGAAPVEIKLPTCPDNSCNEEIEIKAIARDSEKHKGSLKVEDIYFDDENVGLQIKTAKTIFRKNEPIEVEVFSSENAGHVFIDLLAGFSTVSAHNVEIRNGYGKLSIPYRDEFKGRLRIGAAFRVKDDEYKTAQSIIFPEPQSLTVTAETDKEIYRPATDVSLKYSVGGPDGVPTENALGVYILDRAVEERAMSDSDFGGGIDPFASVRNALGYGLGFGGISLKDLNELDLTKPIDPDIELAASVMLTNPYTDSEFFDGDPITAEGAFRSSIEYQLRPSALALNYRYSVNFEHPTDYESFDRILKQNGIKFASLRDPWGTPYRVEFAIDKENSVVSIMSNGPNKTEDDSDDEIRDDDFTAKRLTFNYFRKTGLALDTAVAEYQRETGKYIRDKKTLRKVLKKAGLDLSTLKDRWGRQYEISFGAEQRNYTIDFKSRGKFKDFSWDDFRIWRVFSDYFVPANNRINKIMSEHLNRDGNFPEDEAGFKKVLKDGGLDFDSLRDGWGRPYYIESETREYFSDKITVETQSAPGGKTEEFWVITPVTRKVAVIKVLSLGEDGKKPEYDWRKLYMSSYSGLVSEQARGDKKPKRIVPKTVLEHGRSAIYGVIQDMTGAVIPGAKVTAINVATGGETTTESDSSGAYLIGNIPAGVYRLEFESNGFTKHRFNGISIRAKQLIEINAKLEPGVETTVVDVSSDSAVVVDLSDTKIDTNITRDLIENLPRGTSFGSLLQIAPNVRPEALGAGFQIDGTSGAENTFIVDGQEVTNFRTGQLNPTNSTPFELVGEESRPLKETPRIRNYFPETLLWAPEIVTDADGNVSIKFRLADNITTWKIYAIASNLEGRIGVSEKEIKTFQPFFVDLRPPGILTKGDEISLPVQVRNYTEKKQDVDVTLRSESWFEMFDPTLRPAGTSVAAARPDSLALNVATNMSGRATATTIRGETGRPAVPSSSVSKISIEPNATQNAVFDYRAIDTIVDGLMNVTAIAADESDAIEKPVTVKPDGKEIVANQTKIFGKSTFADVDFPNNALPGSHHAELKLYPNLYAHVAESVEGLLQRPYGCGEQTISSTYPNLMILKFSKPESDISKRARVFLMKGYERLLGYQVASGGFSYWGGKDEANIALTAYALRFLIAAGEFIDVNENVVLRAKTWLAGQQRSNGSWTTYYHSETNEDFRRTWKISTYVVRALAMTINKDDSGQVKTVLETGLLHLADISTRIDEPYSLANLGLAYLQNGQPEKATAVAAKLRKMAIREDGGVYWNLESNTPFFGWGTAGRLETTALVIQLLHHVRRENKDEEEDVLISQGTAFLLKNKDRYGVWYSTQATINVLDALLASLAGEANDPGNRTAGVFVNGKQVKEIELPPAGEPGYPLAVDISPYLGSSRNKIEVRSDANRTLQMQIVAGHYIDWADFVDSPQASGVRQLALDYQCDKYEAKPTEEITCSVKAERIGFRGYGMLLAEIGIPPGADVDRASLDKAKNEDWSFSRYDVLPDRIVIYMWSRAGGTEFGFKFKPRYGINAKTPASSVYDYYNEEARAIVEPKRFVVR